MDKMDNGQNGQNQPSDSRGIRMQANRLCALHLTEARSVERIPDICLLSPYS